MSLRTPTHNELGPGTFPTVRSIAAACRDVTVTSVHAMGFWGAIALPVPILGILYGGYTGQQGRLLAVLLAVNVLCLVVGQNHKRGGQ